MKYSTFGSLKSKIEPFIGDALKKEDLDDKIEIHKKKNDKIERFDEKNLKFRNLLKI